MTLRNTVKWRKRRALFKQQRGMCAICGGQMGFSQRCGQNAVTLDHIVPKSKGGGNAIANLRAVHRRCNEARGDSMDDVFVEAAGLVALRWNVRELA